MTATPRPVPSARKLPRAEREQLLLDAATCEFGVHGYGGASLGAIANRAGVSKALLVTYFGSKDGLYAACVARAGTNLTSRIEDVITQDVPAVEMALRTLAAIFDGLQHRPMDWNVLHDRTAPSNSRSGRIARDERQTIVNQATRGIASLDQFADLDTDNAELLTDVWVGAVTAVVTWWIRHPERTAAEMTTRCTTLLSVLFGN